MNIVEIPASNLNDVWNLVKKDIAQALAYSGNYTDADYVLEQLKQNKFQLWVLWDKTKKTTIEKYYGVVVTEIIQRKLKRSCNIFIVTGRHRQKWQHLVKELESFAIKNECDCMELFARPGWDKIMKTHDYKRTHVVLEKQLIKENE